MTEAATDTAAANATPAPEGDAPQQTQGTETATTTAETQTRSPLSEATPEVKEEGSTSEFLLPDEYKEKPWAEKIKSQEDAYKQIDNLTALVGKKTIKPIDYETASAEDIASYHASLAPESGAEGYKWSEHAMPEITKPMSDVFAEFGINEYQQKGIAEKFDSIIEQIAGDKVAIDTSEDGYLEMMKESFGKDYQASVGIVENALKQFANDDDKKMFDTVDNTTRAAVDRTTHNLVKFYEDRISSILKEHGVTESGAQTEGGEGTHNVKNKAEQRTEIREKMREIDGKPNSHKEMAELQQKLNKLL